MTILSKSSTWSSPALHHPSPDSRPTLRLYGQYRAAVVARHPVDRYRLALDISTRPDAPMKLWRSIEQLSVLNSEDQINEAIKAMSDYVAVKDDVVILNDGDTAKVQEVIKDGLLVLTTAGREIKITQDDIAGQLLNVPFELKSGAHVSLLTAPDRPTWDDTPSGDVELDEYLTEELDAAAATGASAIYGYFPDSDPVSKLALSHTEDGVEFDDELLYYEDDGYIPGDDDGLIDPAIDIRDDEPADVDNQTVVDTVLNAANPYVEQIAKLQKDLQSAEDRNRELTEENYKLEREADKAKQDLQDATRQRVDEFSATRQKLSEALAELEVLKNQKTIPAIVAPDQGFLPYFDMPINTPDQAAAAGRKLDALKAEGWHIRHEQFVQDGKALRHVARLEKVNRAPSPEHHTARAGAPIVQAGEQYAIIGDSPLSPVPTGRPFNPANNRNRNPVPPMGFRSLSPVTTPAPIPSMTQIHDALERGDINAEFAGVVTNAAIMAEYEVLHGSR
jgi:hypothetical protein